MAAPAFDYLDSMMWSIAASGVIMGVAALRLRYSAKTDSFDEGQKNVSSGLGVALFASGLYLFLTGMAISFGLFPQFGTSPSWTYNILFGGASGLGGLLLLSVAVAFYRGKGLQACSYFASIFGLYLISDAYSVWTYKLTSDPTKTTLLYLGPAVALLLSIPAVHFENKWSRVVWAAFAFAFAGGWLYFAMTVTPTHLGS